MMNFVPPAVAASPTSVSAASAQSGLPPVPYCKRGNNGLGVDPKPSGACVNEVGAPTNRAVPRATVMIIAGGDWLSGSTYPSTPKVRREAAVWRDAGFQTRAVEHTSAVVNGKTGLGPTGYQNIVQWYDRIRYQATQSYGPDYPVCVAGGSSSGNLALLLAVVRLPDCIITEAAPTDLGLLKGFGGNSAYNSAVRAFGASDLARWSPVKYRSPYFGMPIAMAHLPDDARVSHAQLEAFAASHPTASTVPLEPSGPILAAGSLLPPLECSDYSLFLERTFAHLCLGGQLGVTQTSIDRWRASTVALVDSTIPGAH
jgi:hypothetical protein